MSPRALRNSVLLQFAVAQKSSLSDGHAFFGRDVRELGKGPRGHFQSALTGGRLLFVVACKRRQRLVQGRALRKKVRARKVLTERSTSLQSTSFLRDVSENLGQTLIVLKDISCSSMTTHEPSIWVSKVANRSHFVTIFKTKCEGGQ